MNKLKMAHEYTKIMLKCAVENGSIYKEDTTMVVNSIIQSSFNLADAMHEENNKRYKLDINKVFEGHEHVFIEGVICWCGKTKSDFEKEWQPDWSQAPDSACCWFVGGISRNRKAYWSDYIPCYKNDETQTTWNGQGMVESPMFGYTGDWRESLRSRP